MVMLIEVPRALLDVVIVLSRVASTDVPAADGEAIARAWPGAVLLTTTGLGHRGVLWDDEVVRRVVRFVGAARATER